MNYYIVFYLLLTLQFVYGHIVTRNTVSQTTNTIGHKIDSVSGNDTTTNQNKSNTTGHGKGIVMDHQIKMISVEKVNGQEKIQYFEQPNTKADVKNNIQHRHKLVRSKTQTKKHNANKNKKLSHASVRSAKTQDLSPGYTVAPTDQPTEPITSPPTFPTTGPPPINTPEPSTQTVTTALPVYTTVPIVNTETTLPPFPNNPTSTTPSVEVTTLPPTELIPTTEPLTEGISTDSPELTTISSPPQVPVQPINTPPPPVPVQPINTPPLPVPVQPINTPPPPVPGQPITTPQPPVPGQPITTPRPSVPGQPITTPKPSVPGQPIPPPQPSIPGQPIPPPQPSVPGQPIPPPQPPVPGQPIPPPQPSVPGQPIGPSPGIPMFPSNPVIDNCPAEVESVGCFQYAGRAREAFNNLLSSIVHGETLEQLFCKCGNMAQQHGRLTFVISDGKCFTGIDESAYNSGGISQQCYNEAGDPCTDSDVYCTGDISAMNVYSIITQSHRSIINVKGKR